MVAGESVLLYNFSDGDRLRKLKMVFLRMGIRIRMISPDLYLQPVGALAHIKGIEPVADVYDGEGFSEEMMIMHGFTDRRLDELLRTLRKNNIARIDLKAVVTPQNMLWNSLELYQEIRKEHEAMAKGTPS